MQRVRVGARTDDPPLQVGIGQLCRLRAVGWNDLVGGWNLGQSPTRTAAGAPCSSRRVCADRTTVCLFLPLSFLIYLFAVPRRLLSRRAIRVQAGRRDGAVANQRVVRSTERSPGMRLV